MSETTTWRETLERASPALRLAIALHAGLDLAAYGYNRRTGTRAQQNRR